MTIGVSVADRTGEPGLRRLAQQALAERVGIRVSQICRYEQGAAQPTLDVI